MLSQEQLKKLHTNQRLFIIEMQKRGIDVNVISYELELIEARLGNHRELILDRDSSIIPYAASAICGDKYLTKKLLKRANLCVANGEQFFHDETELALSFAEKIGYPVVVKPVFGSHGDNVHMDLKNQNAVTNAIESNLRNIGNSRGYIVEEQFEGSEYRIFVTRNGEFAALHRDPAHVIGDGVNTILKLAELENFRRMNPRINSLCNIVLDEMSKQYLSKSGLGFDYIPKKGKKVYVRHNSNVAAGGTCEDYTDIIHPSVTDICKEVLDVFGGLPYAGIDFMSRDITKIQTREMYRIIEVNTVPGVHMHMRPSSGKPRNVARYMVDMIFPETRGAANEE